MFDRTEQRIMGVLIEKELAVPDSYPMTENALLAGCNQKSNRDPEMSLESFELAGALAALREKEWVVRVEGSRADRYRHKLAERLELNLNQKAVLCELLVRGPQAPGALKARVARMGFHGTPGEISAVLEGLRSRSEGPLVEQLPRVPRERDQRWGHCMGPRDESQGVAEAEGTLVPRPSPAPRPVPSPSASSSEPATPAAPAPAPVSPAAPVTAGRPAPDLVDLETRVAQLESELAALAEEVQRLRGGDD